MKRKNFLPCIFTSSRSQGLNFKKGVNFPIEGKPFNEAQNKNLHHTSRNTPLFRALPYFSKNDVGIIYKKEKWLQSQNLAKSTRNR